MHAEGHRFEPVHLHHKGVALDPQMLRICPQSRLGMSKRLAEAVKGWKGRVFLEYLFVEDIQ